MKNGKNELILGIGVESWFRVIGSTPWSIRIVVGRSGCLSVTWVARFSHWNMEGKMSKNCLKVLLQKPALTASSYEGGNSGIFASIGLC